MLNVKLVLTTAPVMGKSNTTLKLGDFVVQVSHPTTILLRLNGRRAECDQCFGLDCESSPVVLMLDAIFQ